MYWPTLDEIKQRFNSKDQTKIDENNFRDKIYMLFSKTWNIDSGQTLLKYFDYETILSVCNNSYIPSKDDLLIITKENNYDLNLIINALLNNENNNKIINNEMEEFTKPKEESHFENDFYDLSDINAHPFSTPKNNLNYYKFLNRVTILEVIGGVDGWISSNQKYFSEDDKKEIKSFIVEQIRNKRIGRISQRSIERLSKIKGWVWDINELNNMILEYCLSKAYDIRSYKDKINSNYYNENMINIDKYPNIHKLIKIKKEEEYLENKFLVIIEDVKNNIIIISDIENEVFMNYINKNKKTTLALIGKKHLISREAVRQKKCKLIGKMLHPVVLSSVLRKYSKNGLSLYINKLIELNKKQKEVTN
jgi:hypothetical protein